MQQEVELMLFYSSIAISLVGITIHYWYFEIYKKRNNDQNDQNKWFDRY